MIQSSLVMMDKFKVSAFAFEQTANLFCVTGLADQKKRRFLLRL